MTADAETSSNSIAESAARLLHWDFLGQVAQLVERSPEKAGVGGSTPSLATTFQSTYRQPRTYTVSYTHLDVYKRQVLVQPDLSVPGHPEIHVIGDLASVTQDGKVLPGVAPVAMQQGRYVADLLVRKLRGQAMRPFRYFDKGSLATIGRNRAVAQFGRLHVSGFPAWFLWVFVHLMYLVEFENRLLVFVEWVYNYICLLYTSRCV